MTMQFDLFTTPSDAPAAPTDPVQGVSVRLSDRCQCGSCDAVIGEGKGPHRHRCFVAGVKDIAAGWQMKRMPSLPKLSRNSANQPHRSPFDATEQIGRHEDKTK